MTATITDTRMSRGYVTSPMPVVTGAAFGAALLIPKPVEAEVAE